MTDTATSHKHPSLTSGAPFLVLAAASCSLIGLLTPFLHPLLPATGTVAWVVDLASHWQWLYTATLLLSVLIASVWSRRWLLFLPAAALPLFSATPAVPQAVDDGGTSISVASANLHGDSATIPPLTAWLQRAQPDLVALQEVDHALAKALQRLPDYPYRVIHPDDSPFGIALLARRPLAGARVEFDAMGIPRIHATLPLDGRRIEVTALHPMPPLSVRFQQQQKAELVLLASGTSDLLIGDLNATPWSQVFGALGRLDWRRASGLRPSWPAWGLGILGIPIDHVLAAPDWRLLDRELGPDLGSDHRPVLVRLQLPPHHPAPNPSEPEPHAP